MGGANEQTGDEKQKQSDRRTWLIKEQTTTLANRTRNGTRIHNNIQECRLTPHKRHVRDGRLLLVLWYPDTYHVVTMLVVHVGDHVSVDERRRMQTRIVWITRRKMREMCSQR